MLTEKAAVRQRKKIAECMLCHDAACSRACPKPDPARILSKSDARPPSR